MSEETNNRLEAFEDEYVFGENESLQERNEGFYFIDAFNNVAKEVISDDFLFDNNELLVGITNEFYSFNSVSDNLPPEVAGKVLEVVFSNLAKYGIK